MNNLGKAIQLFAEFEICEQIMHDDVAAFGAPSECHDLVNKGIGKRYYKHMRKVLKLARARQVKQGIDAMKHHNWFRLVAKLDAKMNPFQ